MVARAGWVHADQLVSRVLGSQALPLRKLFPNGLPQARKESSILAPLRLIGDGAEVQPNVADLVGGERHD